MWNDLLSSQELVALGGGVPGIGGLGGSGRRARRDASTTSHSDIRGLRRSLAAEPHDRDPSGEVAFYSRESGGASPPVAKGR
jgi:hypothetical protein